MESLTYEYRSQNGKYFLKYQQFSLHDTASKDCFPEDTITPVVSEFNNLERSEA